MGQGYPLEQRYKEHSIGIELEYLLKLTEVKLRSQQLQMKNMLKIAVTRLRYLRAKVSSTVHRDRTEIPEPVSTGWEIGTWKVWIGQLVDH